MRQSCVGSWDSHEYAQPPVGSGEPPCGGLSMLTATRTQASRGRWRAHLRAGRGGVPAGLALLRLGSLVPLAQVASAAPSPTLTKMCLPTRSGPERVEADNGHHVPTESDTVQETLIFGDTVYLVGPFTSVADSDGHNSQARSH